ncbi:MAG: DUF1223 domain-containing protein [Isosphaera sp.]|nr:DUF1223 domain-containing protein [Isosphaera sp.]
MSGWILATAGVLMGAGMAGVVLTGTSGANVRFADEPGRGTPVAVVELFTSEGCSSCPPADALLSALIADAGAKNAAVYALSFHVNYWDNLGHPDPFASAAFTDRQYAYADAFRARSVYTPQMVINGSAEFVGSDAKQAARQIEAALSRGTAGTLGLTAARRGDAAEVALDARGLPEGAVVHVALVERGLKTAVRRGENAGRTLAHDNVVRAFATLAPRPAAEGPATITLKAPAGLNWDNAHVVAYAQDGNVGRVLNATRAPVGPAQP